ncbi:Na-translocating system protein MpsC family protein [Thermodesulfobacteriota bacterium]
MIHNSDFEGQREALAIFANTFLQQNFSLFPKSIKVFLGSDFVVIKVDKFSWQADVEIKGGKIDKKLSHEMYSRLFDSVKAIFVARIEQITHKKVLSCRFNIDLEIELCVVDFILESKTNMVRTKLALLFRHHGNRNN